MDDDGLSRSKSHLRFYRAIFFSRTLSIFLHFTKNLKKMKQRIKSEKHGLVGCQSAIYFDVFTVLY